MRRPTLPIAAQPHPTAPRLPKRQAWPGSLTLTRHAGLLPALQQAHGPAAATSGQWLPLGRPRGDHTRQTILRMGIPMSAVLSRVRAVSRQPRVFRNKTDSAGRQHAAACAFAPLDGEGSRSWAAARMELWPYHAFGYITAGREPAVMVTDSLVLLVAGVRLILANVETDAQVFVGALTPGHTVSLCSDRALGGGAANFS